MPKSFSCEKCHFECCKQSNYNSHLLTAKHKMETLETKIEICENKHVLLKCQSIDCGKMYTTRNGLWKHKRKCKMINMELDVINENSVGTVDISSPQEQQSNVYNDKIIQELIVNQQNIILENQEIKTILSDMASKPPTQTIINNNYGNTTTTNNNSSISISS